MHVVRSAIRYWEDQWALREKERAKPRSRCSESGIPAPKTNAAPEDRPEDRPEDPGDAGEDSDTVFVKRTLPPPKRPMTMTVEVKDAKLKDPAVDSRRTCVSVIPAVKAKQRRVISDDEDAKPAAACLACRAAACLRFKFSHTAWKAVHVPSTALDKTANVDAGALLNRLIGV